MIDLHNDVFIKMDKQKFAEYIKDAEQNGVEAIFVSVWTTEMEKPMEQVRRCRQVIDEMDTRVKLLLHIEDAGFVNEGNIEELLSYHPYSVGLTWNYDNPLAGGAKQEGSLTPLGKVVIERLVRAGVCIDVAHLNRKSFWQVVEGSRGIICTHACFDEVCPHGRNLDREQVRALVDMGGLIGLTLVGEFLGGRTRDDVYAHIKYFIDNFGESGLAIGTDFMGTMDLPSGLEGYSDFKGFWEYLEKKGLSKGVIDKIAFGNAKVFLNTYNKL